MPHTLADALEKAEEPDRLVFGVVDQHPESRRDALTNLIPRVHLRYVHIDPVESRGVCWARALVASLHRGEPYLLQIDSHMLFEPGWDRILRVAHDELAAQGHRPILSTYPHGFELEEGTPVISPSAASSRGKVLVLRPREGESLGEGDAVLRFQADYVPSATAIAGCHIAAGFLFGSALLLQEVPYDPHLYFHGEEQSIALRAWTRGWDIFHPTDVPLYHLYKRPHTEHRSHHWHPEWDRLRDFKQVDLVRASAERLADLLYGRRDLGVYGLGRVRTLDDYARFSGIDYPRRQVVRAYSTAYAVP